MTKQFSAVLLISATIFFACNKDDEELPDKGQDFSEIFIDSVADISVRRRSSDTIHIHVGAHGEPGIISLSMAGLPTGITSSFIPVSAIPPFTSTLTVTADSAVVVGSSARATITASLNSSHKTERNLSVTVLPSTDCAREVAGTYTASDVCTFGSGGYTAVVAADSAQPNTRIVFTNFGDAPHRIYADLDCAQGTLSIPSQTVFNAYTVAGSGTFTLTGLSYTFTIYPIGSSTGYPCTGTLSR